MNLAPSPFAPAEFPALPAVRGVAAATASRGFYASQGVIRDDVFLFAFDPAASAAGVFTRSATRSADVDWCREALLTGGGRARAVIANSGNSNAFTGRFGAEKNDATLDALERALGAPRLECFLAATGVIGEPLPSADYVASAVPGLAARLGPADWEACARAFMTTDTYPKGAGAETRIGDTPVSIAGIAKGSGMIAPDMATMLAYVFTDAAIAPSALQALLSRHVDRTLNAITVDGDTSTSDTCMLFATGASGAPLIEDPGDPRLADFDAALGDVMRSLACQLVKDGEGASKFIEISVSGAVSDVSAKAVAAAVANSPLVKTALAAGDANWGRLIMAIGKSGEPIERDAIEIHIGGVEVAREGARAPGYEEAAASAACAKPEISIDIRLGDGRGAFTMWTCDLTHAYIDINGAYRT
ncbi:MAG: bifunctional glutamate N-acetyltransferase/amino-acid acetyltransferase ArgJ [Pseudomonadota bacterium]